MPKQLVDLSDEVLLHIGHFANRDHTIPLPSFGPHWENYPSEIDPGVASDYMALRGTCRRLCRLLVPKNLHARLRNWDDVEVWFTEVPTSVLKGVKRLEINIPRSHAEELIVTKWHTMSALLANLISLEELIIPSIALCRHGNLDSRDTINLKVPATDFLPSLTSLSIQVKCGNCAAALPRLLVPAAPRLRHLRMCTNQTIEEDEDDLHDDGDQSSVKSGEAITAVYTAWKERHPLDKPPIETLYLRLARKEESCASVIEAVSDFPKLRNLHVSAFGLTRSRSNDKIHAINTLGAIIATPSPTGWELKFSNSDISDYYPFEVYPAILQCLPNLTTFDSMFLVEIDQPRPCATYATQETPRSLGASLRRLSANATVVYEDRLRDAMSTIARTMTQAVPSLKNGAFWEATWTEGKRMIWNRWTWEVEKVDGVMKPLVCETPECISREFASNIDGATLSDGYIRLQPMFH
ncbi:hypothetical protein IAR55_003979 [Kwoniella newhampshirensis]|uniref:F-box domain-containing protein n=1 Tax=Kwoniella newhampshirensis TaxID=1651941 RepID=A0AAW0Z187_9TREE